jgi:hypothetical protein
MVSVQYPCVMNVEPSFNTAQQAPDTPEPSFSWQWRKPLRRAKKIASTPMDNKGSYGVLRGVVHRLHQDVLYFQKS